MTLVRIIDPPVPFPADVKIPPALVQRHEGVAIWFREFRVHLWHSHWMERTWAESMVKFMTRGWMIAKVDKIYWLRQRLSGAPGNYSLTPDGQRVYESVTAPSSRTVQQVMELADVSAVDNLPPLPAWIEAKLRPYQRQGARQLFRAVSCGQKEWGYPGAWSGDDLGVGKSYITLAAAIALGLEVCVLCPKSIIGTPPRGSYGGDGWLQVFAWFGVVPKFVLNYEHVRTGRTQWLLPSGKSTTRYQWNEKKVKPEDCIFLEDEAHRLANHSQTRSIAFAAHRCRYPIIDISGTIADSPLNLGATGVPVGLHNGTKQSYDLFLAGHGCTKGRAKWNFNNQSDEGARGLQKINQKVYPLRGSRIRIADLGADFPETQIFLQAIDVPNANEINAEYRAAMQCVNEMERQNLYDPERRRNMALAAWTKAFQKSEIAMAPGLIDFGEMEMEAGRSLAFFTSFDQSRITIMRYFKTACGIYGGQNDFQRQGSIRMFQEDRSRVICCNTMAGGVGVSLHDVRGEYPRTAIICPHPQAKAFKQVFGRVHREGGKSCSRQAVAYARNTLMEDICDNLRARLCSIDQINDGDLRPKLMF